MPAEHKLSVRDGEHVREVLLIGTVTVGRSPTCEISSADRRLSRTHAAFDVVGGDVVVRDLDSANGTTVNGTRITEHRLVAGDQVEVGPFVVQLIEMAVGDSDRRPPNAGGDDEKTVMLPPRARQTPPSLTDAAAPAALPATERHTSDDATVMLPRRSLTSPAATDAAVPLPVPTATTRPPEDEKTVRLPLRALATAPVPAAPAVISPPPPSMPAATIPPPAEEPKEETAIPKTRRASAELTFANAALLSIMPLVLVSFLAGFANALMQPDERTPLLRAYYVALATSAVDLLRTSREPVMPIDAVTSALRRQAGVTSARIIGADGRVLAPLDQAGTRVPAPVTIDAAPRIADTADGRVEVQVPGTTGDGRPVVVSLTVNPELLSPAPGRSTLPTVLLIASLGAAWLVARRVTAMTDSRLSRLGEEVELMTTRQISAARDPFSLSGGRRILDAVTFALSSAGRVAGGSRGVQQPGDDALAGATAGAAIEADAAFRIVKVDQGCESLLGMNIHTAAGAHLIDALPDQAVSGEVMRLVTVASAGQPASGEVVTGDRATSLAIDVVRGNGAAPLSIRFRRL